ncbi:UDP-N-acetylmuramate dehydrogenase [Aliiglaciecola sp. LCG003]|uniref:UDP-N-acetylmuramate dehydrogenase n=1 Tax=Aliiglaciecola sp. LCG003 TaxID=3053655 RepID=UPI002573F509|nr:UDP-N-acetylmuramate dehydrogenase [Aliiglaciecola sp. LCG003]WJG08840.1 UDP-N-acetylmuramate dehydrogenase [Aliiglaciecola sp. LCG003]
MYSLKSLHTFGFNNHARNLLILDENFNDLCQLEQPYWILGQGSNCVFLEDFDGTIVKIESDGKQLTELEHEYQLTVSAGENWHQLVCFCMENGLYGLENLALIPGTVGAAPIQNIGAYGVELNRFIESVEFIDIRSLQKRRFSQLECKFGYRDSVFKRDMQGQFIITKVVLRIPKLWVPIAFYGELQRLKEPTALDIFNKVIQIRSAKLPDPRQIGNAGSFFKNPLVSKKHYAALQCEWHDIPCYEVDQTSVKVPSAWLIDKLGFKGQKEGGIQCHPTQALVLTNDGTGTGSQLLTLARKIQHQVEATFSIKLENEVRLVGSKGMIEL